MNIKIGNGPTALRVVLLFLVLVALAIPAPAHAAGAGVGVPKVVTAMMEGIPVFGM